MADHSFVDPLGREPLHRSDGGRLIGGGWVSVCISAICFVITLMYPIRTIGGDLDPSSLQTKFIILVMAASLLSLGVILLALGCVVRAIYFLPGEAMKLCDEAVRADMMRAALETENRLKQMERPS